jgi:flagellar basal-body rod protein FlgG
LHGTWPLHRSVRHAGRDGPAGPAGQRSRQCLDARLQGRPRLAALVRRPHAEHSSDGSTVGPLGQGAAIDKQQTDLRPQALRDTGQPLDLAVTGDGYFGVQTKQGVRYTRNGAFTADAKGNLVDQMGNQVLGVGGKPIAVANGTIDTTKVALFNLRNPVKQGDSNFTGQAGGQATGTVKSGALEGSGVDPARAMVDLMASMRSMEATQRAITTIDTSLGQTASQVGGLPG